MLKGHIRSYSKAKKSAEKEANFNAVDKKPFTSKEYKKLSPYEKKPMNPRKVALTKGKSKRKEGR